MKLKEVVVEWAKVHKAVGSEGFAPAWSVNAVLTKEQQDIVQEEALRVSDGRHGAPWKEKDGKIWVVMKRKETSAKGEPNRKVRVVDMKKQPFTEEIGNGSVCNLIATAFEYDKAGKKGVTFVLEAVQVVKHKEAIGDEDFDDYDNPDKPQGEDFDN